MAGDGDTEHATATEQSPLLDRRLGSITHEDAESIISSHLSKDERLLGDTAVGERLPYNDYTTIDWLHDLVKDSFRVRALHAHPGLRYKVLSILDASSGWLAAALIGILTACVAFVVDVGVATISDWKTGYCSDGWHKSRDMCCAGKTPLGEVYGDGGGMLYGIGIGWKEGNSLLRPLADTGETCAKWYPWSTNYYGSFGIYVGFALAFGIISGLVTLTTKKSLPAAAPGHGDKYPAHLRVKNGHNHDRNQIPHVSSGDNTPAPTGKSMYMAAGSGIPEIKTILSGFVIPNFLSLHVLTVKAVGSIFAVSTGMCLGKEGPFVHISTCVAYLVSVRIPKYRDNGRKLREMLSAGCASGLSVAFGAPIGGVLFAYEEISTYFPRKVLWRAFVCSLFAAVTLRALNPTGTGKLVLFETDYGTTYEPVHYLVFIGLGVAGGLFGGVFCKANFLWSRTFRKWSVIQQYPVLEVGLVVLATALLQYPNPLAREPGDVIIKNLLVDCQGGRVEAYVCEMEGKDGGKGRYIGWLVYGTLVKLVLTIITFGIKVPSGIIIPALDGGAFFGRLVGQATIGSISPGIFAMVGAGAFLAGVSRMTISLAVIMFELTGELEFIVPNMIGIMVAKWVADALEKEGVYDLAQTVLGHPFLDLDQCMNLVQGEQHLVEELIPPKQTMKEITVDLGGNGKFPRALLAEKLEQLRRRGLMDAGLVLVQHGMLQGYLAEGELDFGLNELGKEWPHDAMVRLLGSPSGEDGEEYDMSPFVDRTPLTICAKAPMEYAVEMFGKLGLRHLCVIEEGSGKMVGVIIKKRLVVWLEGLKHGH